MTVEMIEVEKIRADLGLVESLKLGIKTYLDTCKDLEVKDATSFDILTEIYKTSREWEKRIEFYRKESNKPFQDRINANNDRAKELLVGLHEILAIAKDKTQKYHLMLEEQKKKEEEKAKEAADVIGMETVPYVPPLEKTIRGDGATAYTRTIRKFRIVDLTKVPLKYLQINEEAVNQDIKLGVDQIEGLEIYSEKLTTLKSR